MMNTKLWGFSGSLLGALLLSACGNAQQDTQKPAPTASAASTVATSASTPVAAGNKRIAITAIVEHPALDAVRAGALEQLKAEGFIEGQNLTVDFQSAQGNAATAAQIAKKFAGDKPDVVLAIATPSAQAMVSATQETPIIYAAVTDPVAAKLVSSWDASNTNVSGVSDQLPLAPQIDLMKKLVPNLKSVGYVYSPSEVNSTIVLDELKTELTKQNITLNAAPAQRTSDVLTAARSLNGKAELIYTSLDNNVVSSFESMYKAGTEMKIPLLASDPDSVKRGAAAALGVNYHDIGVEAGKMMGRVLRGEAVGSIPSQKMSKFDLHISKKHAAEQGLTLSDEVLKSATKVID